MRAWSLLTQDIATLGYGDPNGGERCKQTDAPRLHGYPARGPRRYWLNIGLAFPHKDSNGFNVVLQALPLDGKIVCREITEEEAENPQQRGRQDTGRTGQGGRRR